MTHATNIFLRNRGALANEQHRVLVAQEALKPMTIRARSVSRICYEEVSSKASNVLYVTSNSTSGRP